MSINAGLPIDKTLWWYIKEGVKWVIITVLCFQLAMCTYQAIPSTDKYNNIMEKTRAYEECILTQVSQGRFAECKRLRDELNTLKEHWNRTSGEARTL